MRNEIFHKVSLSSKKAFDWLLDLKEKQSPVALKCARLGYDLARLQNEAQAAFEVLPNRTTIGVFGASQAGKSYLVSNIAAQNGCMQTKWGDLEVDFLSHVNPRGGDKEATGIVTRFTHRPQSGIKDFPLEIRVLSEIEIVMILVNSFYKDFNFEGPLTQIVNDMFKAESLEQHFSSCKVFPLSDKPLVDFSDLVKLYDYVRGVACAPLATFDIEDPFWQNFFSLAVRLPLEGRAQLYSILWGKLQVLTKAFEKIAMELSKLKGVSLVYAKSDVYFAIKNGEYIQYSDNINSVTCLDKIFDEDMRSVTVSLDKEGQNLASVKVPLFAAAVLEVLFPLYGKTPLEDFDVLDFPGARSRQPYTYNDFKSKESEIKNEVMPHYLVEGGGQLLRRGKVAYLFERYNGRHEIDLMLFCLNSAAQSEVSSLTPIITDWIYTNIGKDAKERTKFGKNPLVGVLTRFDEAFTKNLEAQAKVEGDIGIIATAVERINGCEWLNAWNIDPNLGAQPLRQFFFVRRPNLPNSSKIFAMQAGVETHVLESMQGKVTDFCNQIAKEPRFNDLVYGGKLDGFKTLEAVFTPSDGGALYINSFLMENYRDFRDIKAHFVNKIRKKIKDINNILSNYASLDAHKAALASKNQADYIIKSLCQCDMFAHFFCDLHALQELDERIVIENYAQNYSQSVSNAERFASEVIKLYKAQLEDMCSGAGFEQLFGILSLSFTDREVNAVSATQNAKELYSFFYDQEHDCFISDKTQLKKNFYNLMCAYVGELNKALDALKIREYLIKSLNEDESKGLTIEDLSAIQGRKAMKIMSDFSTYLRSDMLNHDLVCDGNRQLFTESFEIDGNLPHLTQEHLNIAERYRHDYFYVLQDLICGANLTSANQYGLTDTENQQLLAILEVYQSAIEA